MSTPTLKAPFPAIGGKSRVAELVWSRLGDPSNYIEPFAFSAAMLLGRPSPPRIETINDANGFVANFWRAIRADPDATADAADWPVNEADLHARHRWLVFSDEARGQLARVKADPDFFDPKIAGWWAWGACCWIGSGWCEEPRDGVVGSAGWNQAPNIGGWNGDGQGGVGVNARTSDVSEKRLMLGGGNFSERTHHGVGVNKLSDADHDKRPRLASFDAPGLGVNAERPLSQQMPMLRDAFPGGVCGAGPSEGRPQLADAFARGRGVHGNDAAEACADRNAWLRAWFGRLRDRLRVVRVCCGDWLRVCDSASVTTRLGMTGVFLDPPYRKKKADGTSNRSASLYANDRTQDVEALVTDVIAYCSERGDDPQMRLAVCCLEGEGYEVLAAKGWTVVAWKSSGYGNRSEAGTANRERERIWFSPHCIDPDKGSGLLF